MIEPTLGDIGLAVSALVLLYNTVQAHFIVKQCNEIKHQTNGLNAALIKATGEIEFARGLKQGTKI